MSVVHIKQVNFRENNDMSFLSGETEHVRYKLVSVAQGSTVLCFACCRKYSLKEYNYSCTMLANDY